MTATDQDYSGNPPVLSEQSRGHLKTLAIFYWVAAGLQACGGLFTIVFLPAHFKMISSFMTASGEQLPPYLGVIYLVMGGFTVLLVALFMWLLILVARALPECRRRTLVYVMAAIMCLNLPLGTILGIFTFVVMNRPDIQAVFDYNARQAS